MFGRSKLCATITGSSRCREEAISSWISLLADAVSATIGALVNALRPPIFSMDETCDPCITDISSDAIIHYASITDQSEMQCASSSATNIRCLLTYLSERIVHQGFVVAASGDKNTKVYKVRFYPYSSGISLTKSVFTTDYIWQN